MKRTKPQIRMIAGYLIVILSFNLLAFLLPFRHTVVFWTGYIFGIASLLLQVVVFAIAFQGVKNARSRFYGVPIIRVGIMYLACQMVVSFLAMALAGIESIPAWPIVLISVLLLAAAALGIIVTDSTRDEIERQDAVLKGNTSTMRKLQSISRQLVNQCEDKTTCGELRKLSEQLQFSDPVSNKATIEAEQELEAMLNEIMQALLDGDNASATALCKKAGVAVSERDRICKLNK